VFSSRDVVYAANLYLVDVPGPSLLSSTTQQNSASVSTPSAAPLPMQAPPPTKPNYDPFQSLTSSHPSSRSATPGPPSLLQSQQASKPSQLSSDPFAALSSPAPRQASSSLSTHRARLPAPSPSASLFDFASPKSPPPQAQATSSSLQTSNGASADDDWNFASALPDDTTHLPSANDLIVSDTSVKIAFHVSRPHVEGSLVLIQATFTNNTPNLITEYAFQVAVTKVRP